MTCENCRVQYNDSTIGGKDVVILCLKHAAVDELIAALKYTAATIREWRETGNANEQIEAALQKAGTIWHS